MIGLDRLQYWIDTGRFKSDCVNVGTLRAAGLLRPRTQQIQITAFGAQYFRQKLTIEAAKATPAAIARVRECGGTLTLKPYEAPPKRFGEKVVVQVDENERRLREQMHLRAIAKKERLRQHREALKEKQVWFEGQGDWMWVTPEQIKNQQ